MDLNAKDKARLQKAVEGRNSSQGYVLGDKTAYKTLIDAGLVEANDEIKDGKNVAMRASDLGVQTFTGAEGGGEATQNPAGTVATTAAKPTFDVTKGVPIPKTRRRSKETGSRYPFDTLEIGDSFHVPPTEKMPDPAKSLASSITAANRRFAIKLDGQHKSKKGTMVDNYELTRKFIIRPVDETDPGGVGARVWRVELPANKTLSDTDAAAAAEADGDDEGGAE